MSSSERLSLHVPEPAVRPGDTLRTTAEVIESKPSSSKPDRGMARIRYAAVNQDGDEVLSFITIHILRRRTAANA